MDELEKEKGASESKKYPNPLEKRVICRSHSVKCTDVVLLVLPRRTDIRKPAPFTDLYVMQT